MAQKSTVAKADKRQNKHIKYLFKKQNKKKVKKSNLSICLLIYLSIYFLSANLCGFRDDFKDTVLAMSLIALV